MRIALRALNIVPSTLCLQPACMRSVLEEPIVSIVPVTDTIGVQYAFDLQITQGFYTVVLAYAILQWVLRRRNVNIDDQS